MNRLPALLLVAPLALTASHAASFAAQTQPETFTLPPPTPSPTPAPAGPADESAGIAIPPRVVPTAAPSPRPLATPTSAPAPAPTSSANPRPLATPTLRPLPTPSPATRVPVAPLADETIAEDPTSLPEPGPAEVAPSSDTPPTPLPAEDNPPLASAAPESLSDQTNASDGWLWAAGGLAAVGLLVGGALMWRRRQPTALRLATPVAATSTPPPIADLPRLDLTLEITGATRSVMMFTLQYRLNIANRSDRAVTDLNLAVHLACARASASAGAATGAGAGTGNASSPGVAQARATIARVGPHQARSVTGEVRLPLSAIQPLRQGKTPLFVPLVHVTLESAGESAGNGAADNGGQRAMTRSFVIGTPSASGTGRLHPILLDQPPGSIAGLAAQAIAIPPISAAT